jgi:hypothetical protein
VGDLPSEAKETEQAQGHVRNRRSACLAESGQIVAKANQRGKDTGSGTSLEKDGSSVVEDGGRDEEESEPSLVTSSELIGLNPGQYVVQEEAAVDQVPSGIPSGWTRVKLEPDC